MLCTCKAHIAELWTKPLRYPSFLSGVCGNQRVHLFNRVHQLEVRILGRQFQLKYQSIKFVDKLVINKMRKESVKECRQVMKVYISGCVIAV